MLRLTERRNEQGIKVESLENNELRDDAVNPPHVCRSACSGPTY